MSPSFDAPVTGVSETVTVCSVVTVTCVAADVAGTVIDVRPAAAPAGRAALSSVVGAVVVTAGSVTIVEAGAVEIESDCSGEISPEESGLLIVVEAAAGALGAGPVTWADALGPVPAATLGVESAGGAEVGVEPLGVDAPAAGALDSTVAGVVPASVLGPAAGVVAPAAGAVESALGVVAVAGVAFCPAGVCAEASVDGVPLAAGAASRTERGASADVVAVPASGACEPVELTVPLWAGPAGTYEAGVWPGGIAGGAGPD